MKHSMEYGGYYNIKYIYNYCCAYYSKWNLINYWWDKKIYTFVNSNIYINIYINKLVFLIKQLLLWISIRIGSEYTEFDFINPNIYIYIYAFITYNYNLYTPFIIRPDINAFYNGNWKDETPEICWMPFPCYILFWMFFV